MCNGSYTAILDLQDILISFQESKISWLMKYGISWIFMHIRITVYLPCIVKPWINKPLLLVLINVLIFLILLS